MVGTVSNSVPGLLLFENTGTRARPAFLRRTGAANPLTGLGSAELTGTYSAPGTVIADLDADGDLDLFYDTTFGPSSSSDSMIYLENVGTAKSPVFVEHGGPGSPCFVPMTDSSSRRLGQTASDLDGDGNVDLVLAPLANTGHAPVMPVVFLPEPLRAAALAIGALALRLFAGLRRGRPGGRRA